MKWLRIFFERMISIFRKIEMPLSHCRDANGNLNPELIKEAYVLFDYENKPICICVLANGVWVTLPFSEQLDNELKAILTGGRYTNRYLSALIEIQDKYEADLLERNAIMSNSKKNRAE